MHKRFLPILALILWLFAPGSVKQLHAQEGAQQTEQNNEDEFEDFDDEFSTDSSSQTQRGRDPLIGYNQERALGESNFNKRMA